MAKDAANNKQYGDWLYYLLNGQCDLDEEFNTWVEDVRQKYGDLTQEEHEV